MTTLIILPLLLGTVIAVLLVMSAGRRRARIAGSSTLVGEAMRRRGLTPADAESAGIEHEFFAAARRCSGCVAEAQCRASLARVLPGNLPSQCPNREFFDHLAIHKVARRVSAIRERI